MKLNNRISKFIVNLCTVIKSNMKQQDIHIPLCDKCSLESASIFKHLTPDEVNHSILKRISVSINEEIFFTRRVTV